MTIRMTDGVLPDLPDHEIIARMFDDVWSELGRLLGKVREGSIVDAAKVPATLKELRQIALKIADERERFEQCRKQAAGSVGAAGLDFHAARDEIGRRLARLRDAGAG